MAGPCSRWSTVVREGLSEVGGTCSEAAREPFPPEAKAQQGGRSQLPGGHRRWPSCAAAPGSVGPGPPCREGQGSFRGGQVVRRGSSVFSVTLFPDRGRGPGGRSWDVFCLRLQPYSGAGQRPELRSGSVQPERSGMSSPGPQGPGEWMGFYGHESEALGHELSQSSG